MPCQHQPALIIGLCRFGPQSGDQIGFAIRTGVQGLHLHLETQSVSEARQCFDDPAVDASQWGSGELTEGWATSC